MQASTTDVPPLSEEERAEFYRESVLRNGARGARLLATLAALWGLTDPLIFAGDRASQGRMLSLHAGCALTLGALSLGLARSAWVRRRPILWSMVALLLCTAIIGVSVAHLGGIETPWFHFFYPAAFLNIVAAIRFRLRLVLNYAAAALYALSFFLVRPGDLGSPMALIAISFLIFIFLVGSLAGELATRLMLESHAHALRERRFKLTLEDQVREQTAEIRAFAWKLDQAREHERRHLAHELHDELGQELSALHYAARLAIQRHGQGDRRIEPNLLQIDQLISRTSLSLRNLLLFLRPPLLEELGLGEALERLVEQNRAVAPFNIELRYEPLPPIDPQTSTVIFRVVQEALTNALRHAQARHVWVHLAPRDRGIDLSVEDDGVGLPSERPARGLSGLGLVGMQQRVEGLGGRVSFCSREPQGTRVWAHIPAEFPAESPLSPATPRETKPA
jgi:signal transduction histidine kinase